MLTLQTNTWNLLIRCIGVVFLFIIGYLFIKVGLQQFNNGTAIFWKIKTIHFFYIVILGMLFFLLTVLVSLLGIIKVQVDKSVDVMAFISLFNMKMISINDIDNYFVTIHRNRLKSWNGLLLRLKDGKTIQLAGQNLESISDLTEYLNDKGIPCLGEKRMKFPFN